MVTFMVTLMVIAAVVSIGSQLIPAYMDHNTMRTIMNKMSEENGLARQTDSGIRDIMTKRMRMNNIRGFDLEERLETNRAEGGTELILNYEVRIHLVHNLNLIAAFDKKVPLKISTGQCV